MRSTKHFHTLAEAAERAGAPVATVRDWFTDKRKYGGRPHLFELSAKDQDAPPGGTRYLSAFTTLAVCVTAALVRIGVRVETAAYAANYLTLTLNGRPKRQNGQMVYGGKSKTLLVINAAGQPEVYRADAESYPMILALIETNGPAAVLVVDPIVQRIIQKAAEQ